MPPKKSSVAAGASQSNLLKFRRKASTGMTTRSMSEAATGGDAEQLSLKYLTTDTSLAHVITMIILRICRKITVDYKIEKRLIYYLLLVILGGILGDFAPVVCRALMPIRTAKDSIFNIYFVKIGWGWTLLLTTPFILMTSEVMANFIPKDNIQSSSSSSTASSSPTVTSSTPVIVTNGVHESKWSKVLFFLKKIISKDLTRIIVNTFIWYFSTNSFVAIESVYGTCSESKYTTRTSCIKIGSGKWTGFDISGHTFLLIFSTLIILEELKVMIGWEHPFGHHLNALNQDLKRKKNQKHQQFISWNKFSIPIRINFVLLTLLTLIWDFMLVQTTLFYHTMLQKAIAALWAIVLWSISYRVLYGAKFLSAVVRPPTKPEMVL